LLGSLALVVYSQIEVLSLGLLANLAYLMAQVMRSKDRKPMAIWLGLFVVLTCKPQKHLNRCF
jgi:hypothetical protein